MAVTEEEEEEELEKHHFYNGTNFEQSYINDFIKKTEITNDELVVEFTEEDIEEVKAHLEAQEAEAAVAMV